MADLPGLKMVGRGDRDMWWGKPDLPDGIEFLDGFGVFGGVCVIMLLGSAIPGSGEDEGEYQQLMVMKRGLQAATVYEYTPIVAIHWPPILGNGDSGYSELLEKYRILLCLYGHLHGELSELGPVWNVRGVRYQLVAADNTVFAPMPLEWEEAKKVTLLT